MKPLDIYSNEKNKVEDGTIADEVTKKEDEKATNVASSSKDLRASKDGVSNDDKVAKATKGSTENMAFRYKVVKNETKKDIRKKTINNESKDETDENASKKKNLGFFDLIFIVGIVLVYMLYGRNYTSKIFTSNPILINQLVLYILPFLYALIRKARIKELYSIKCPNIVDILAGFSIIIGVMCLDSCLQYLLSRYFKIVSNTSTGVENTGLEFSMAILTLAIFPAICEEFFYRGYVYGILKNKTKSLMAMIVSALIFGLFHMNLAQGISAFFVGLFLAYVIGSSKSILVVVFMHFINNLVYLWMVYYPKQFSYVPLLSKKVNKLSDVLYLLLGSLFFIVPGIMLCGVRRNKLND